MKLKKFLKKLKYMLKTITMKKNSYNGPFNENDIDLLLNENYSVFVIKYNKKSKTYTVVLKQLKNLMEC